MEAVKGPFINYVTHLGGGGRGLAIVLRNVTEGGGGVDRSDNH